MRGRILGVKKSKILGVMIIVNLAIFITFIFFNAFLLSEYKTLWFYAFSVLVGVYEITKSRFFKLDSAFYFGTATLLVGISGFVFTFTRTLEYLSLYLLADFALTSLLCAIVCGQRFHLILFYSLFFVLIFDLVQKLNLITYTISIAICIGFLLLLILIISVSFLMSRNKKGAKK